MKFYCIKDEEGILRPRSGIWEYSTYGKNDADKYIKHQKECSIVLIEIKEINEKENNNRSGRKYMQ